MAYCRSIKPPLIQQELFNEDRRPAVKPNKSKSTTQRPRHENKETCYSDLL